MKKLLLFLWLLSGLASVLKAQDINQAFLDLEALCVSKMSGRGYQDSGHYFAAGYIASRFLELGLKGVRSQEIFPENYFQPFQVRINSIDTLSLIVKGKQLIPGKDFIAHAASGSAYGTLKFKHLNYGMGEDWEGSRIRGGALAMRLGYPPDYKTNKITQKMFSDQTSMAFKLEMAHIYKPDILIIEKEKLTASLSSNVFPFACLEVLKGGLPPKIKKVEVNIKSRLQNISTQNIIAEIKGNNFPDSVIIICAHYDHLGKQGSAVFTGANDNASGIAFLLGLAGFFSQAQHSPDYTLLFIAFGAEEAGLQGARHYVNNMSPEDKNKICFVLNFDLMGNGDEGITLVAGTEYPEITNLIKNEVLAFSPNYSIELRPNAPNSDHYPFTQSGIPALFTYTRGGPPHYHDIFDVPEAVKFPEWDLLMHAFRNTIQKRMKYGK